jgi:hypothetical protein
MTRIRREKHTARCRELNLCRRLGISRERVRELKALDKCDICGVPITGLNHNVDHSHDTNKIRGVLCRSCNLGLGMFDDNIDRLRIAADYIEVEHYAHS